MTPDEDLPEAATTLEALINAHAALTARLVPLLARAMDGGGDAPEWRLVEALTAKAGAIDAMIQVCPCALLSRPPPTDARH